MRTILIASALALAISAPAFAGGVDCTAEAGVKNWGKAQAQVKESISNNPAYDGYVVNNWAQFMKAEADMHPELDIKVGEQTQLAIAGCGIGSEAP